MSPILLTLQLFLSSLLLGALYTLLALGLNLIWGVMKVINFAHGDIIIMGSFLVYWFHTLFSIDLHICLLIVFIVSSLLGSLYYYGVIRPIKDIELTTLITTFGVSYALSNIMKIWWTADYRSIGYPASPLNLYGVMIPLNRLTWLVVGVTVTVILYMFLKFTLPGKGMRATSYDLEASQLMGIDIDKMYLLCFALGTGLAGLAGVLYAFAFSFSPASGGDLNLLAFIVVVLGGLGNYYGTIAGAFALAFATIITEYSLGPLYKDLVGFIFMIIVLIIRNWRRT